MKFLSTVIVCSLLTACGWSTKPSPHLTPAQAAFIKANCPDLTPLNDPSFGAANLKIVEVAGVYYRCRASMYSPPQEAKKK